MMRPGAMNEEAERAARIEWDAMARYRLDCVEQWPESAYKQAVLAAIHASLERFSAWPQMNAEVTRIFGVVRTWRAAA